MSYHTKHYDIPQHKRAAAATWEPLLDTPRGRWEPPTRRPSPPPRREAPPPAGYHGRPPTRGMERGRTREDRDRRYDESPRRRDRSEDEESWHTCSTCDKLTRKPRRRGNERRRHREPSPVAHQRHHKQTAPCDDHRAGWRRDDSGATRDSPRNRRPISHHLENQRAEPLLRAPEAIPAARGGAPPWRTDVPQTPLSNRSAHAPRAPTGPFDVSAHWPTRSQAQAGDAERGDRAPAARAVRHNSQPVLIALCAPPGYNNMPMCREIRGRLCDLLRQRIRAACGGDASGRMLTNIELFNVRAELYEKIIKPFKEGLVATMPNASDKQACAAQGLRDQLQRAQRDPTCFAVVTNYVVNEVGVLDAILECNPPPDQGETGTPLVFVELEVAPPLNEDGEGPACGDSTWRDDVMRYVTSEEKTEDARARIQQEYTTYELKLRDGITRRLALSEQEGRCHVIRIPVGPYVSHGTPGHKLGHPDTNTLANERQVLALRVANEVLACAPLAELTSLYHPD